MISSALPNSRHERHPHRRMPTEARWVVAVAAGILVLAGGLLLRLRYSWWLLEGPEYRAAFPEVTGLAQGAMVRYAGLDVGRVRRVDIDSADARHVLVTFRVREGTPVLTSTHAAVVAAGGPLTSFLNLRPGDQTAPPAAPGTRLVGEEGPTLLQTLERASQVLDRTDTLLVAARPLADGEFFAQLARTTANVDTLVGVVARGVDRWGPRLEATMRRTEQVLARTDQVLARTDQALAVLDSARPALAQAPGEMVAVLRETRAVLSDVRAGVAEGGGLQEMMRNLTLASDNLARLSTRVEGNPMSVLQRRRPGRKDAGPALQD